MKVANIILGVVLTIVFGSQLYAQKQTNIINANKTENASKKTCGTTEYLQHLKNKDPNFEENRSIYEQNIAKYIESQSNAKSANQLITIPVVVHVIYNNTTQNISLAQVQSQIDVLNKDFTRTNSDASYTPSAFASVAGDAQINFCLASRDPNGNPTNGINRVATNKSSFTSPDDIKFNADGGADAWDPTMYLNIWVCDISGIGSILGFAEFPGNNVSSTFGVVIDYRYFGTIGTATFPYNMGRTATHEVGHALSLKHIWGDDGTACSGSDNCTDTPNQSSSSESCPSFPQFDNCTSFGNGIMFMNYMDYVNDDCMNLFTVNQCSRMNAVLNTSPYNALKTSNGCTPSTPVGSVLDAGISTIIAPTGSSCGTAVNPKVTLKNFGSTTLTSVKINYQIDNGSVSTYNWTGSLAYSATINVDLPILTASSGNHTFKAYTSNPNNGSDVSSTNDQSTSNFTAGTQSISSIYSFSENFDNGFPNNFTIVNPDGLQGWEFSPNKAFFPSVFMNNYTYIDGTGQTDDFILPGLNLSNTPSPQLTFFVAYREYQNNSFTESLDVAVSTDCGVNFTSVYNKGGSSLATVTPPTSDPFTPEINEWRKETISLASYSSSTNLIVRFRNTSGYGNFLFITEINLSSFVDINEQQIDNLVNIYPNPNNGLFTVDLSPLLSENSIVSVFNSIGQIVFNKQKENTSKMLINLNSLTNGVYFIQVKSNEGILQKKIVINHD